jgi:hypothetical protein
MHEAKESIYYLERGSRFLFAIASPSAYFYNFSRKSLLSHRHQPVTRGSERSFFDLSMKSPLSHHHQPVR